ncbi:hypothetical protein PENDEC_c022G03831 [Penicillium decumbens]|uniref:Nascent polypeptide-associated complex subunit alpha-like UBA domain-containing protein n=1 Tax=Penicillium decumbens TaxID=69771 RepID=A0A1V6P0W7_PENDC|nr:hypothetical protein PENDEC_c022G03831 [Penicillium decumbens]
MSDSIPSATGAPDSVEQPLPANAEDRKAAAALDSLHTNEIAADAAPKAPSSAEQEALGRAMSRLEIAAGKGSVKKDTAETQKKEAEVKIKAVKIAAGDVAFLADQLDLHKNKATDLLKAHEGDVTLAMKAFIAPSLGA